MKYSLHKAAKLFDSRRLKLIRGGKARVSFILFELIVRKLSRGETEDMNFTAFSMLLEKIFLIHEPSRKLNIAENQCQFVNILSLLPPLPCLLYLRRKQIDYHTMTSWSVFAFFLSIFAHFLRDEKPEEEG